jgi:CheY-like chemotaxis protein
MSQDKVSVALITDHSLTNLAIAQSVDQSRFVLHQFSSDCPQLTARLIELDPALIFVRATLKCGNGFELCDRIKDESALQRARIVFFSQDESNREKAIQHRANHFLNMPISQEETACIVKSLAEHQRTILFVDDSKLQHEVVVPHLAEEGYKVLEAWNGEEAISILETHSVDLLVTDLEMPIMDGFSLCRFVKSLWNRQSLPF